MTAMSHEERMTLYENKTQIFNKKKQQKIQKLSSSSMFTVAENNIRKPLTI